MAGLVDLHGQPLRKELLTREVAGPTLAGVRSPIAGYPADGMNPLRLANLLREADQGNPLRYFELAELIEERDLHYLGVMGTRKRAVTQLDIRVEAGGEDARSVEIADRITDWLSRDELADELFDIQDAVGKARSHTEIIWDTSTGQWQPGQLIWRDPRWFTVERADLTTPMLRGGEDGNGQDSPLPGGKFVIHTAKAKSGLPIRSGLARAAVWAWMFKAFTQRDWAIFTQTYGQPVRLGKFQTGASAEDRATLYRAVANIAGDCAAIIPAGMEIEFVESRNVTAGSDLYERRADWLDRQVSKAVLGQTNTTDAQAGGLGSGQADVHNDVRQDIERADARALCATLNRDLIRTWVDLEWGPQQRYPRLIIERPEPEDLDRLSSSLAKLVPLGLRVSAKQVRDKFGLAAPEGDDEVLTPPRAADPAPDMPAGEEAEAPGVTIHAAQPAPPPAPADQIGDRIAADTAAATDAWLAQLRDMMASAGDLGELREMVRAAYPELDAAGIVPTIAGGLVAAHAAGRGDVEDQAGDA